MADQPSQEPSDDDRESHRRELRDIFVAATGAEEFTETQERGPSSKVVVAEGSVAASVTDIAKADGLADAYTDPLYEADGT